MANDTPPPITQAGLEALADSLSDAADVLHARLMRAIRAGSPGGAAARDMLLADGIPHDVAQALFGQEVELRQRADGLYQDAATLAAAGLDADQHALLALNTQAHVAMAAIERVQDLVAITAELLAMGAAIASGKPDKIIAPYDKLRLHLAQLQLAGAAPPA